MLAMATDSKSKEESENIKTGKRVTVSHFFKIINIKTNKNYRSKTRN